MTAKAFLSALLVLSAALVTGCNIAAGPDSRAVQVIGDNSKAAGEQQDVPKDSKTAQLEEQVRRANEQAELERQRREIAEQQAELEKQRREFTEERLKQAEESDLNEETENRGSSYTPPSYNEPAPNYSNTTARVRQPYRVPQTQYVYEEEVYEEVEEPDDAEYSEEVYNFTFGENCRVPNIGETFCYEGVLYAVVAQQGRTVQVVAVEEY